MLTYSQAEVLFQTARNKVKGKPLCNNTRLVKCGDDYGIKLHRTIVVCIKANGHYEVNNGGWYSHTSKDRINSYNPIRIWSERGEWFARYNNETIPYFNGLSTREWGINERGE